MFKKMTLLAAAAATALSATAASAATEIQWWHAFTGRLGDLLAEQIETFNNSQDEYTVVGSHKGNYSETLNAGIAAFRAGEQPHLLMVFEVGTATMMGAKGAIKPVYELMEETWQGLRSGCLYGRGQRVLHDHRRRDAVAALQLLDAGSLREQGPRWRRRALDASTWTCRRGRKLARRWMRLKESGTRMPADDGVAELDSPRKPRCMA